MIRPKLRAKRQPDLTLVSKARTVSDAMNAHPELFPDSAAALAALTAALDLFAADTLAVAEAKTTLRIVVDTKNRHRQAVEDALRVLSSQVNLAAKGNVGVIHAAGMQGSNEPVPVTMTKVEALRVQPSVREAELLARWKPVRGVRVYRVQINTDPAMGSTTWVDKLTCTKAKCALNHDLVSGQKVWIRVCAVGARDTGAWSNAVAKMVP